MDKTTRQILTWAAVIIIGFLLIAGYNRPMNLKIDVEEQLGNQAYELVRQADVVNKAQEGFAAIVGLDNAQILGIVREAEALRQKIAVYCDNVTQTCELPDDPAEREAINNQVLAFQQASLDIIAYSQTHPQLRAADAFDDFMISIEGSANRVAVQGKIISGKIADLKRFCLNFPGSLFCSMRGVSADEFKFYRAPAGKEEMPVNALPTITMP